MGENGQRFLRASMALTRCGDGGGPSSARAHWVVRTPATAGSRNNRGEGQSRNRIAEVLARGLVAPGCSTNTGTGRRGA